MNERKHEGIEEGRLRERERQRESREREREKGCIRE